MFEDSVEDHVDKAGALLSGTEKGEGEGKEGDNDESKVHLLLKCAPDSLFSWMLLLDDLLYISQKLCTCKKVEHEFHLNSLWSP